MTALSESFSLMIIHDVFSLPISTFLLFSRVGKPVLDKYALSQVSCKWTEVGTDPYMLTY